MALRASGAGGPPGAALQEHQEETRQGCLCNKAPLICELCEQGCLCNKAPLVCELREDRDRFSLGYDVLPDMEQALEKCF